MLQTEPPQYDLAIVGGGGAGIMAHLRAVLNFDRSVVFIGDANTKRKGRGTWVAEVDNIPGMHDLKRPITKTGQSTLQWISQHKDLKDRSTVVSQSVESIRKEGDTFTLQYNNKGKIQTLQAQHVVLATGIMDTMPKINGSIEPNFPFANRGDFILCVRCDGHQTFGHRLAIIGTNDTTIHIGAMMKERYAHETIDVLTNGQTPQFQDKALDLASKYQFRFHNEPIQEILQDPTTKRLRGFRLDNKEVEATKAIISLGVIVYNDLICALGGKVDAAGKAIVNEKYETSVPNLFAVGDMITGTKMQIYTAWDEAVDAADEINRRLRSTKRKALFT